MNFTLPVGNANDNRIESTNQAKHSVLCERSRIDFLKYI
jgi:hypothetical protein